MPGRKQHFIPQHFQKSFKIKNSDAKIWLYRKGNSKPIPASISDVAAQRDFYSNPSMNNDQTLDDLITDYEKILHPKVDELRRLEIRENIPAAEIAELVTHLAVRSAYMRGMIKDAAISIAEAIQLVATGSIGGRKMTLPKHSIPPAIETHIIKTIEELGLAAQTAISDQTLAKLLYFGLREGADDFLPSIKGLLERLAEELTDRSATISHQAQTRALADELAPTARAKVLGELEWTVVEGPEGGAILPDCTSLAFDGVNWSSLILVREEDIKAVALPLTPERIALGLASDAPKVDISNFNNFAAQASHTFFLSSSCKPELEQEIPKLGGMVRSELSKMTGSALTESVKNLFFTAPNYSQTSEEHAAAQTSWTTGDHINQFSISVNFLDFGDEAFAVNVSKVLKSILILFAEHMSVSGVTGFMFANDYKAALKSIERGFEASSEISPVEDGDLIGVGMPLTVLEQGEVKSQVVLRSSIAFDLLAEDESIRSEAINVVVHMLASAALTRLMAKKFPAQILKPIDNEYEAMIFSYCSGVFDAFFCASISCSSKARLDTYQELAHESLLSALDKIPTLRRAYRTHGNMNRLFPESSDLLRQLTLAIARLLGTMKCQDVELVEGSAMERLLSENRLLGWFQLFRHDLASFDDGLEGWAQFEDLFFVNRHFERLAAHFSLVPEPAEGAGIYVHVPGQVDIDLLDVDRQ